MGAQLCRIPHRECAKVTLTPDLDQRAHHGESPPDVGVDWPLKEEEGRKDFS